MENFVDRVYLEKPGGKKENEKRGRDSVGWWEIHIHSSSLVSDPENPSGYDGLYGRHGRHDASDTYRNYRWWRRWHLPRSPRFLHATATALSYASFCLLPSFSSSIGSIDDIQLDDRAYACDDYGVATGATVRGGILVNANTTVVLPAQVEVDVFGDDESPGRSVTVLVSRVDLVAFRARFFADQSGRMVTEEGFDSEEAAADNDEVGFDDTVLE